MSRIRALSSPELIPSGSSSAGNIEHQPLKGVGLEGISTIVKLLLKLIQDHNEASLKHNDDWKIQRVTTMMMILDDLKTRIQKSQQSLGKKELRRCNTDLKPSRQSQTPRRPPNEPSLPDDIQKLRRELSTSLAARKSLQMMCSSLGKEKEIMARELSRKAQELNGMEELINDLRAQNEMLLQKVRACAAEHKEKKEDFQGSSAVLQERNRELSEQLLRSIDGYRSLKRRYRDVQEENAAIQEVLKDLAEELKAGTHRLHGLQDKITRINEETPANLEDEISALESLFQRLDTKISNHG